ncbi:MAG: Ig-like domain-containing protein, partial [Gammaproteobacteria bacterium]|nr:Ig-like domain-containing protein [Gammaproteobacteria bacterium]
MTRIRLWATLKFLLAGSILATLISCSCSSNTSLSMQDVNSPEVESIEPGRFKTRVAINSFVSVTFSEPMNGSTINTDSFYITDEARNTVPAQVITSERRAALKPSQLLSPYTRYTINIVRTVEDAQGNPMILDFQSIFTTGNELDNTPPEVDSVYPKENARSINVDTYVSVKFSENIDPTLVDSDTFFVQDLLGNVIEGTIEISDAEVKFTPTEPLAYQTQYVVTARQMKDLANNPMLIPFTSSFSTETAPDTTGPVVVNSYPKNNENNIPVNTSISVSFNELLDSTITADSITLSSNGQTISGFVQIKDNVILFTPAAPLSSLTQYTVALTNNIKDLVGNPLETSFQWQFTTGDGSDKTPPVVSYIQPEAGAKNVANNNAITVTFSEAIDPASLTTDQFKVYANGIYATGDISYSDGTAIFKPKNLLSNSSTYTVTIASGISDLSGNLSTEEYSWTFTTGTARDDNIPRVSSVYPVDGDSDFSVNSAIITRFTEAMDPSSLTPDSYYLTDSNGSKVKSTVVTIGATSTLRPLENLNFSENYTVTIAAGASDLADNRTLEAYSWSFTTSSLEDTTNPSISSSTPASGNQSAAVNRGIIVSFTENMDTATINQNSFYLQDTTGTLIKGAITATEDTAIFTPLANLQYSRTYVVTVLNTVLDMAGNPLNKVYTWNFSTSSEPDNTPPTINYSIPGEGNLAAVNNMLQIQFSEAMNTSSMNNANILLADKDGNAVDITVKALESIAQIKPLSDLNFDTDYVLTMSTAVEDLAGNGLAEQFTLNFKTSLHPDLAPPFVVSSNPYNLEQKVDISIAPKLTFSENLDCLAITDSDLQLLYQNVAISGTVTCSNNTLTFEPATLLNTQAEYVIQANTSIKDLSGDNLQEQFQATFNTAPWTQQTGTVLSDQAFSVVLDSTGNLFTSGFTNGSFGDLNKGSSDIFITKHDKNSVHLWTKQFGSSTDDFVTASAVDASDNVYLTGYTYGNLANSSLGNSDIFIIKLDADGNVLWQQQLGTSEDDAANDITIDNDGNVVLAAYSFAGFNGNISSGQHDIVIIKLDSAGNLLWSTQYGSTENDIPNGLAIDSNNNIAITGYTLGDLQSATNQGDSDVFVSLLDKDGNHLWTTTSGSFLTDIAQDIAIDSADNIVITGFTLDAL